MSSVSLLPYNTFGVDARCQALHTFGHEDELRTLLKNRGTDTALVLGGGSNVLFRSDWPGEVWLNRIRGMEVVREDLDFVWVRCGAGEVWHELVLFAVNHGWGGIENLSLIPGSVGAGPMQNIGAYGVELMSTFFELEAINRQTGAMRTFMADECEFGYRESIFKRSLKGQYVISRVTLRLAKNPQINTSYGAIQAELEKMGVVQPDAKAVSDAVIRIRQSKLPNPAELGNAGSFFKNPVVSEEHAKALLESHPSMPHYPAPGGVKLAAGWLIEKSGWKGHRSGSCGVHALQALVLVNYGGATGSEIYNLSEQILRDVESKFAVTLEREVNVL